MVGLVQKTLKDGLGASFIGYFYDDGTALYPASVIWDAAQGALVSWTATSPVRGAGTAGTADTGVVTVQGIGSGVAVPTNVNGWNGREYETVAASQTDQAMGATGAAGDDFDGLLIIPGTTAAGAVSIKDGAGSAISIFAGGGTTALTSLIPFYVPIGARSLSGAWKVTTGANVTALGFGNFT